MEKKKTGFIVAISTLSVVICALIGVIIFLLVNQVDDDVQMATAEKQIVSKQITKNVEENILDEEKADEAEEKKETGEYEIVLDGYKFTVPSTYSCVIVEDIGPIIYIDDVFNMKLVVKDGSYEEDMKNPDSLLEKTIEAGGEITQDVKETELNGKKYAYFRMVLDGNEQFVVVTAATDKEQRFGGQILILSDEVTDKELLNVFDEIVTTAVVTDEKNTTEEELSEQEYENNIGEKKEKSALIYRGKTVNYKVTEGFYSVYESTEDGLYASENFIAKDNSVWVDTMLMENDKTGRDDVILDWESAQSYIEAESSGEYTVETIEIDGYEFYYIVESYEHKGSLFQRIYAACDVGGTNIYAISATAIDWDGTLTLDTIKEFLSIKEGN